MRYTYAPTANRRSGFTLVEVLIVSPLIIFVVAIIIATMTTMTGSALQSRERNRMVYDIQEGLNQIESDIRLSRGVVLSTGTLPSGQGSNSSFSGTDPFTSGDNTLVLEQLSTSKNPLDPTRDLLYYSNAPYNCANSLRHLNSTVRHQVVFFVDDNALKRRTIVSFDGSVCGVASVNDAGIWQRNSCKTTNTTLCFTLDTIISRNVGSVQFEYFASPSESTPTTPAASSSSIRVTITGNKAVAGKSVTHTSSLRASRIN